MNNFFNDPRSPIPNSRHGIVLLVVLGVLALLSVLAITFVRLTQLERSISKNYVDRTRATMLAESGIEAAIARIQSWPGGINSRQLDDMAYNPSDPGVPLVRADKPSFPSPVNPPAGVSGQASGFVGAGSYVQRGDFFKLKVEDESGKLNLNDSDDRIDPDDPASSRRLSSIVENLAEVLYAVKFGPGIGLIVMAEIQEARQNAGGKFNSLDEIAQALDEAGISGINPKETVKLQHKFLQNITLWSWTDPNTIKPSPAFRGDQTTGGVRETGFRQDPTEFYYPASVDTNRPLDVDVDFEKAYDNDVFFWRSMQHKGLSLEPRSPININTATKEMIASVLTGIQGIYLYEYGHEGFGRDEIGGVGGVYGWIHRIVNFAMPFPLLYGYERPPDQPNRSSNARWCLQPTDFYPDERRAFFDKRLHLGNTFGSVRCSERIELVVANDIAQAIYNRIHNDETPFGTWQEFKKFIYDHFDYYDNYHFYGVDMNDTHEDLYKRYQADAIIANCCPNSDLNDFNANATLWKFIDKADLLTYTTEFCFEPGGVFKIDSLGQIAGKSSDIQASREIKTVIRVFETRRITSQADFFPKPATGGSRVESLDLFFGENDQAVTTAWADHPLAVGTPTGVLTESYPEGLVTDDEERIDKAVYDGYVCLATTQAINQIDSSPYFRASFNGSLDADEAPGETEQFKDDLPAPEAGPFWTTQDCQEQAHESKLLFTRKEYLKEPVECGNLYADGAYSEAFRTIMFHSINNFGKLFYQNGRGGTNHIRCGEGSLLFWVKPNWHPEHSPRIRKLFSITNINKVTNSDVMRRCQTPLPDGSLPPGVEPGMSCFNLWYLPGENSYTVDQGESVGGKYSGRIPAVARHFIFGIQFRKFRGLVSYPANYRERPLRDTDEDGLRDDNARPVHNFLGHTWNFVAISWNSWVAADTMQINDNRIVEQVELQNHFVTHGGVGDRLRLDPWLNFMPVTNGEIYGVPEPWGNPVPVAHIAPIKEENPMRLGEYARASGNFSADSTYDEVVCTQGAFGLNLDLHYRDGRFYYSEDAPATYTTAPLNLVNKPGRIDSKVTLRSLSWTVWWPDSILRPDPTFPTTAPQDGTLTERNWYRIESADMNPNDIDHPAYPDLPDPLWSSESDKEDWDQMTVDLELPDGSWLFADSGDYPGAATGATGISNPEGTGLKNLDGSLIRISSNESLRLKFFFNIRQVNNKPLHDTPVLDDITITFIPGKPTVLRWQVIQ
ncbi:hypothetical protein ACFL54_08575 [Planctomycetota bacterium]